MKQLYFLEVDARYHDDIMREMLETVSLPKKERLQKYRCDIDRKIGAYAEILLRLMISKVTGTGCSDIEIEAGKTGKPYLACTPRLEFNVTHTRNAVAVALSDRPIGVDVERIRQIDLSLARDIFSENELIWLNADSQNRLCRFFELWTRKEAFVKCSGNGLTDDLKTVDTTVRLSNEIFSTLYFSDYVVSVCAEDTFYGTDAEIIAEDELIEQWRRHEAPAPVYDFSNGERV
jgi:4'-phosphopantetheinyl transferase